MFYIIQENLFKEHHFNSLTEYLDRYDLDYEIVRFKPFTDHIEFKTHRKDVWCFGSNNLAKVAKKYDWNPGSMYNENHDFEIYSIHYRNNMLNSDGKIVSLANSHIKELPQFFFARPTKDTKSFSGQIFSKSSWKQWTEDLTDSNLIQGLTEETKVLIAPIKETQQEIRCWIIDGEPITMSQYKIGRRVVYQNQDHNKEAYYFAKEMARVFSPARAFVLDICLYEDKYKIVEINTINCSGFYDLDMSKLIQALEKAF